MGNDLSVKQIVSSGHCYSYILESAKEVFIIDPHISNVAAYREYLGSNDRKLCGIIDTHTHADHISSAAILQKEFSAPVYMSPKAVSSLEIQVVEDGKELQLGQVKLQIWNAPGHTDDSIVVISPEAVFTGDVLLINSVGRTDFQNGSPEDMFDTLARLKTLDHSLTVYPAHDYNHVASSTLGDEAANNPFMKESNKQNFCDNARSKTLEKPFNMDKIIETNRGGNASEIARISASEAKDRIDSGEWEIVDVRRDEEVKALRIEPHIHIPLDKLAAQAPKLLDNSKKLLMLCRSGGRATTGAQILQSMGYADIAVIEGGITSWEKAQLPVVKEKVPVSLERQVRMIAGCLVLAGTILALTVNVWFIAIAIFVGCGLLFAGITDSCMMGMLLMKLPYNQVKLTPAASGGCCSSSNDPAPSGSCSIGGGSCSLDNKDNNSGGSCSL